jgi:hypothetical protein
MEGMEHGEGMEGMSHEEMMRMHHGEGAEGMEGMEGMQHGEGMEGMEHGEMDDDDDTADADEEADAAAMPVHGMPGAMPDLTNMLDSQSLWDATMAWSIAQYLEAHPDAQVMHVVGSFHVQTGTGIPEHLMRYVPNVRTLIVTVEPVSDVTAFDPEEHEDLGDFVILSDESLPRTFDSAP